MKTAPSLIVMRRKYGAHTVRVCYSTFGEGGQNAIGPELYEEMGAIRARETMAASEIQGSEPHFLGLKDFGFSKSAAEAFKFWGHDEALRRMVLEIRKLRPDVIITQPFGHRVTITAIIRPRPGWWSKRSTPPPIRVSFRNS